MSETFRTRGDAVDPAHRPLKRRNAVRVIIKAGDAVLLFFDTDPGQPGSGWWMLPGGGIDHGESPTIAAIREVSEETGLQIVASDLVGPIATRVVWHGYSDQVTVQSEDIFVIEVPERFEPDLAGLTADEQLTIQRWDWWQIASLPPEPIWPANLASWVALAGEPQRWPADLGVVEESTVSAALGYRQAT